MRKKIFTLLTLMLAVCSGAWATETSVNFLTDKNDNNENFSSFAKNSSITAGNGLLKIFSNNNTNFLSSDNNKKGYRFDRNTFVFYFSGNADLTVLFSQNNTTDGSLVLKPFTSVKSLADLTTSDITGQGAAVPYTSVSPIPSEGAWATVPASVTVAEDMLSWTAVKGGLEVYWEDLSPGYYELSISASHECYMYGFTADVTSATNYDITWNNGGHGTAPTSPTSASTFTLPTMEADGYTNTDWTANVTVTVNKADVSAGTPIPTGTSVTLQGNTTFTGVWKGNSTFALTSANEVEVAIDGQSTIITENNAGTVTYSSADESVATVSSSGVITAVAAGKTTITVTDPGSAEVAGGSATVTVLVPYPNPAAADSYVINKTLHAFSNNGNTKYYFTNGFTISVSSSASCDYASLENNTGIKYSHARSYTINVPSNVTVKWAEIEARNNYPTDKAEANWGTVFGTSYADIPLPYSTEDPAFKEFVIEEPSSGASLGLNPGGNQWQAIITLYTTTYGAKHTVTYDAGEGSGSMDSEERRANNSFTLPASAFTNPTEKSFAGWHCSADDVVYAAGASYTMVDKDVTFTAQYDNVEGKMIYKVALTSNTAGTVTGALGGSAIVSVQNSNSNGGYKFGSKGNHIGLTLSGGNTFKTGDIINIHTTQTAGQGTIAFYNDADGTELLYDTENRGNGTENAVENQDNKIVLPAETNGKTTIYICRTKDDTSNKWNGYVDYIEVYRPAVVTLNGSGFATYSRKSDFEIFSGATAYKMTLNYAAGTVTGSSIDTAIPAGEGVLFKGTAGDEVKIIETTGAPTIEGNNLHGTTTADGSLATKTVGYTYYALSGNTFKKLTGDLVANKAYFEVDGSGDVQARDFTIIFEDEETGINNVKREAINNNRFYNLNGQEITQPTKGLYIVNGKKVVIK